MIFNFRLVSDEVDNFRREISIDADATFLDLRNAICDSVDYDKNQMCSFFICDDNWEKGKEITLEDMGSESDEDVYLMDETILSDYIDDGQRLIFVFDYMTDRCFFIEMKKSVPGKNLKDPVCIPWILRNLRPKTLLQHRSTTSTRISTEAMSSMTMNLTPPVLMK